MIGNERQNEGEMSANENIRTKEVGDGEYMNGSE